MTSVPSASTTRIFLRRELKREIRVTFKLSRRNFEQLFLRVVEALGERHSFPMRGRQTQVFLHLLRNAFRAEKVVREASSWQERETAFVKLTRELELENASLRHELEDLRRQVARMDSEGSKENPGHDC